MLTDKVQFNAPIPGESLTAELGGRPWQTPPKLATVDEAIDYYMERMSSEDFMEQVVDVLESGVPVSTIANTLQLASVMDGIHTVDVGTLVVPVIMEMMIHSGRFVMMLISITLVIFLPITWVFVIAAVATLALNLLSAQDLHFGKDK